MLVRSGACVSVSEVRVKSCEGSCPSSSSPMERYPYYTSHCKCCKPTAFEEINVQMLCNTRRITTMKIPIIKECDCNQCSSSSGPTNTPDQDKGTEGSSDEQQSNDAPSLHTKISNFIRNLF